MDTHAAFAPAGRIQELSFDEIEEVGGGPAGCLVAVVIVGALLIAGAIGYWDDHGDENRNDRKK